MRLVICAILTEQRCTRPAEKSRDMWPRSRPEDGRRLRDKMDTNSRGVSDPQGGPGTATGFVEGGRSRPDCDNNPAESGGSLRRPTGKRSCRAAATKSQRTYQ